jgi:hypothetical protein
MVIGTIGDDEHVEDNPSSDHNPKRLNGANVVNAEDPMIGSKYTAQDADEEINIILRKRDPRTKYIIWQRRIVYGNGYTNPWKWRRYTGTSDPHTGHWHHSVKDSADTNEASWLNITPPRKVTYMEFTVKVPNLKQGDSDVDYPGYNFIQRLQDLLGVEADGEYGPVTSAAIARRGFGNGRTLTEGAVRSIFGLANP